MTGVDHRATAHENVRFAMGERPVRRFGFLIFGLVHAVIALVEEVAGLRRAQEAGVEQQKIATLFTLSNLGYLTDEALADLGNDAFYGALARVTRSPATPFDGEAERVSLRPEIARALGLDYDTKETTE